jgi:predicted TIM-barrel fold metal-dependent hydrolase
MPSNDDDFARNSPFPPIREDWLASHQEPILDPALPIIDPHHHLWEHPHWRYMLPDLMQDLGSGHNITATVFAECHAMYKAAGPEATRPVGETEFVTGVAAMSESGNYGPTRVCAGIVGHVDLTLGARVTDVLEAHIRSGGGRFRGIRDITVWDASPDVRCTTILPAKERMLDPAFRDGFARLAPLEMSFDAWLYFTQLPELIDLVTKFPRTTVILDHIGGVLGVGPYRGRRNEVFSAWKRSIEALARRPNVYVKVGGMGMHTCGFDFHERPNPPSSEQLAAAWRPYVETCIINFGTERCMFESNFPVDRCSYTYPVMWNAFKRLASGCSAEEKANLFSETARRAYRL